MPTGRKKEEVIKELKLEQVLPPALAVRTTMNEEKLEQLKSSIERIGLQQPIIVKAVGKGKFEIVMGERRYIAHKELQRETIRAIVTKMDNYVYELAKYDENAAREDVNAMDEARFIERMHKKFKKPQKELAKELGKSEGYISQRLTIMGAPPAVQEALEDGIITFSVARELAMIDDDKELGSLLYFAAQNGVTPAVAKSWRLSYESRKAMEGNAPPVMDENEMNETQSAPNMFTCEACRQGIEMNRMKILKVCPECNKTVRNA